MIPYLFVPSFKPSQGLGEQLVISKGTHFTDGQMEDKGGRTYLALAGPIPDSL